MKICSKCHVEKPINEFHKDRTNKSGLSYQCKLCKYDQEKAYRKNHREKYLQQLKRSYQRHREKRLLKKKIWYTNHCEEQKEYRKNNREKRNAQYRAWYEKNHEKRTSKQYKDRYGITLEEKRSMWHKQNGKCLICVKELLTSKDCCVDHDHETKKIRGLICNNCNALLGMAKDNPQILQAAIDYLQKHERTEMGNNP